MHVIRSHGTIATAAMTLLAMVIGLAVAWLQPPERPVARWHATLHRHAAHAPTLAIVEIDDEALRRFGPWPLRRDLYARLGERLLDAGAAKIVFNVCFDAIQSEAADAALATFVEAHPGRVGMAAMRLYDARHRQYPEMPLPRLARAAAVHSAALDFVHDDGAVETVEYATAFPGRTLPTTAAMLAGVEGPATASLPIDFSIDPTSIATIGFADVMSGRIDPARLRGRTVLVGLTASAEPHDQFPTAVYGMLDGTRLQALQAATLLGGVPLRIGGWTLVLALAPLAWFAVAVAGLRGCAIATTGAALAIAAAVLAPAVLLVSAYPALIEMLAAAMLAAMRPVVRANLGPSGRRKGDGPIDFWPSPRAGGE